MTWPFHGPRWAVPHNRWTNRPEYEDAALRVLRSGHVGQGPQVEVFELELASRFRHGGAACCVSSGTAALRLALMLLGKRDITVPTYACSALWHAAADDALTPCPRLVDCDPDTLNTPDATVVVHTYGLLATVGPEQIEDFTHAPGAPGAGAMGAFSVISFGATKPLGIGAGGALLGPRDAIERARAMRDYDTWTGEGQAFNWSMSDLHAAIGRELLRRLDEEIEWRARVAGIYNEALYSHGRPLGWNNLVDRGWYRYVIRVKDVAKAQAHFAERGIETINPLTPDELLHRRLRISGRHFPNAERVVHETLSLPIWPGMTDAQVGTVASALGALGLGGDPSLWPLGGQA